MDMHQDVAAMAATAFSQHRFRRGRGTSWILARPRTGIYSFRVTWTPGALIITGDVGDAIYRLWPSFADPWTAAEVVRGAEFDYLTSKSNFRTEFDQAASVRTLLEQADERQKHSHDRQLWDAIVKRYGWRSAAGDPVRIAQARAGAELREVGLSEGDIYSLTGESDLIRYSYPPKARWTYEALQLWAREMAGREPVWHQIWRAVRRLLTEVKTYRRRPVLHRPEVYLSTRSFNGSRYWRRVVGANGGDVWKAVTPWRVGPLRFHRVGFWRDHGSTWQGSLPRDVDVTRLPEACVYP